MFVVPSDSGRSAGPIATVDVPASTTSALTVPAGTTRLASLGFSRAGTTTAPPARTSTAGAAAVWRTVTRDWPAGIPEVSLTNGVSAGLPSAVRWATTVALAPAGSVTPLADNRGAPDASGASAG